MRRLILVAGSAGVGGLLALAALAFLHHQAMPIQALAVGVVAAVSVVLIRAPWSHLPLYIGLWLDLGVAVTASLLASVGHALTFGVAFVVFRGPEVGMLFGTALLVALATTGLSYTHLRLAAEVEAQERRLADLQQASLQSRLSALSAQINPHFLFNTLNTLAELVHEDEDAAEDLVTDLSAMMRTALRGSSGPVPLSRELDLVRRLLRIESARLGERLVWTIEGEETVASLDVAIPGLLIQPLVENAVKHGVASRSEGGWVSVGLAVEDGRVQVRIADDGPGLPEDVAHELTEGSLSMRGTEGHGGGLRNCVERLRLTWPDGSARLLHDRDEPGTSLVLVLPVEGGAR